MNKFDSLGDRMKKFYENRTRNLLPRRTYTIIRVDGKAFHSYTRGLEKPFDLRLISDMDETAIYMCENIQGAKLAFVQSDEISIILTDFDKIETNAWFDGNIQKMASVSASLATAKFNSLRKERFENQNGGFMKPPKLAMFDSRVFTIPSFNEVVNYIIWRQQDTTRNSISSVAQNLYNHKELHGKNTDMMQEMIFQKGINWNDYDIKLKRGRLIVKEEYNKGEAVRSRWVSTPPPIFTKDKEVLNKILPTL